MIKHFDEDQPFYAMQGGVDKSFQDWSVYKMAVHYVEAIVKINPNDPCNIGRLCVGKFVAFDVIKKLKTQEREVSLKRNSSFLC